MTRHVGVELEFSRLAPDRAAEVVAATLGGHIAAAATHRLEVSVPDLGTFTVTLDTRYADKGQSHSKLEQKARQLAGEIGIVLLPVEVTTPPLPADRLAIAQRLAEALAEAGATGTEASPFYAFGLHLNPEVEDTRPQALLAVIRAFSLGYAQLADRIQVDPTRRLLRFASPYPEAYVRAVTRPGYGPDLDGLIADYIEANPTRSRALDMLALFAHLRPETIKTALPKEPVKARPTFHYRLPNASPEEPHWSVEREWRRWQAIEDLAHDAPRLQAICRAFQAGDRPADDPDWTTISGQWLAIRDAP